MLDGPARILDSAGAYRIPQKAWKLHVGRSGAHSVFCRSIQNPPKGVETAWPTGVGRPDSVFCILYSAGRTRRTFCILYSVFCILPAAYALRPDSVFCILYSAGGHVHVMHGGVGLV